LLVFHAGKRFGFEFRFLGDKLRFRPLAAMAGELAAL
jgi:hypothetical protein